LVAYHIKNVTSFTSYECPLSIKVAASPLLNPVHFILNATVCSFCVCHYSVQCRNMAELATLALPPCCNTAPVCSWAGSLHRSQHVQMCHS